MKKNWIQKTMDDRGISISELAEILNLSERTVRSYYKGWSKPGKIARMNILKVFDLEEEEAEP